MAQSDSELFDYHALKLEIVISNEFDVVPTSSNNHLEYVSAELSWFPREDSRQKLDSISTEPRSEFNELTGFLFEWQQPLQKSFSLEEKAVISTLNEFKKVYRKTAFPISDLDPAYAKYLEPGEITDINEDIRQKASEIVQQEDDLYRAVFKLAEWVETNVEYDLSTVIAEATQKSSWTMENRRGVCDEITALLISMCRSVGIPARFVTGVSYSNIDLINNGWGPHGWAEVYFPEVGWVPFDITYKEQGYVDAAHIKLKTSPDAQESSVSYASRGWNTDILPGKLDYSVEVLSYDHKLAELVDLEAYVAEPQTGFGSYNLVILSVKNPHDYYVTTRIHLAGVNELEIIGDNPQSLVLAPREEKKIYWLLKTSSELNPGFVYTFPLRMTASRGEQAETEFKATKQGKFFPKEYMNLFIITEQPEEKVYSRNVLVTCSASNNKIYLNESVNLNCVVDNKGDKPLSQLKICLGDDCATTRIPPREAAGFNYEMDFKNLGIKTLMFRIENDIAEKSYYTVIDVQDKPLLDISELEFPERLYFDQSSEIKFFVKKKSSTQPRDVKVQVEHRLMQEEWNLQSLEQDYQFRVMLRGEHLYFDRNDFTIIVTYKDEQGNEYSAKKDFSIMLEDTTLIQKIKIWINLFDYRISEWISRWQ